MAKAVSVQKYPVSPVLHWASLAFIGIGIATFASGLNASPERIWPAYLTAFFFFTTLSIGGLFFTAVLNVTKAGWGVTVRRLTEAFASFLPYCFVGGLLLILGSD